MSTMRVGSRLRRRRRLAATVVPLKPPPTMAIVRVGEFKSALPVLEPPISLADELYQAGRDRVTSRVHWRRSGGRRSGSRRCPAACPAARRCGDSLRAALIDDQLVAGPRGGLQQLRDCGIRFDLLPEAVHELLQQLAVSGIA